MLPRLVTALLLTLPALAPAAVTVVHVWPTQRSADSFRRISEYVDGTENSGRETVLRTRPDARDGCYFLTRTKADTPVAGATLVLEIVLPGSPEVHTYPFSVDVPAGRRVFQVGVTGTDWPDTQTRPAAWRVTIRSADGALLADSPSFLWSVPAPKAN